METEKCDKCGVEVEKGTLIRDQAFDAAQLRCNKCIVPDKKPRKPRKKKEVPVLAAPSSAIEAMAVKFLQNPPPPVDLVALRKEAQKWAEECGFKSARADEGSKEDFDRYGFGYVFHLREVGGKERMGTARFTCRGERNMWTMDGMITG